MGKGSTSLFEKEERQKVFTPLMGAWSFESLSNLLEYHHVGLSLSVCLHVCLPVCQPFFFTSSSAYLCILSLLRGGSCLSHCLMSICLPVA